jgi:hypothetical protein
VRESECSSLLLSLLRIERCFWSSCARGHKPHGRRGTRARHAAQYFPLAAPLDLANVIRSIYPIARAPCLAFGCCCCVGLPGHKLRRRGERGARAPPLRGLNTNGHHHESIPPQGTPNRSIPLPAALPGLWFFPEFRSIWGRLVLLAPQPQGKQQQQASFIRIVRRSSKPLTHPQTAAPPPWPPQPLLVAAAGH